jgi:hypothetical protein
MRPPVSLISSFDVNSNGVLSYDSKIRELYLVFPLSTHTSIFFSCGEPVPSSDSKTSTSDQMDSEIHNVMENPLVAGYLGTP